MENNESSQPESKSEVGDGNQFLLFSVNGELYASPLLDVREIVTPQSLKAVPNTIDCFLGVMNLRGQIVGVIDLRRRLSPSGDPPEGESLLVFETEGGVLAALVDEVISVMSFSDKEIDREPTVASRVPLEYLVGIAKHDEKLVSIIQLKNILEKEELVKCNHLMSA